MDAYFGKWAKKAGLINLIRISVFFSIVGVVMTGCRQKWGWHGIETILAVIMSSIYLLSSALQTVERKNLSSSSVSRDSNSKHG